MSRSKCLIFQAVLAIVAVLILTTAIFAKPLRFSSIQSPLVLMTQKDTTINCENRRPEVMKPEDIRRMIQSARNAWMTGDSEAWAALFSTDGRVIVHGNRWVGQDAIRKSLTDFAAGSASVKIDIRRIMIDGNQAVVEWYWQDRDKAGRRNQADDAIVIDFKANHIIRWREYIDNKTLTLLPRE
jgi:uncharacterized protein (TIGR02246 family)